MTTYFQTQPPHEVFFRIQAPDGTEKNTFGLQLLDYRRNEGSALFILKPDRCFRSSSGTGTDSSTGSSSGSSSNSSSDSSRTWGYFLDRYLNKNEDVGEEELRAFGFDLFKALISDSGLGEAWAGIQAASGGEPILMTVELGGNTEGMASLPLELLHSSETGFLFARPGSGIQRTLLQTPSRPFTVATTPRVLFAWACPPCSGDPFDPQTHIDTLTELFGPDDRLKRDDRLTIIDNASLAKLKDSLNKADDAIPYDYVHILAHGYRDGHSAGICLTGPDGGLDPVSAQRLASVIRGHSLRLVFLPG